MDTKISRRNLLKLSSLTLASLSVPAFAQTVNQPNILWITSEDNSPFLGCYGDKNATTPNLDQLAAEGTCYDKAFANCAVCAPTRSTIITGMYACSLGTQHMRSGNEVPKSIKFYPQYLRQAGYYCTNNSKTDYNLVQHSEIWDQCDNKAHYRNGKDGKPFFAIFNLTTSHESSVHKSIPTAQLRHKPEDMQLAPYHPDTKDIRHDYAQYYDKIEDMDTRVGKIIADLKKDGLYDNTIIFYYADHGGVIARSKRFLYDSGTRVPFIIRFPEKYKHLAPTKVGGRCDRIISFVDLAPTLLSITGIKIPSHLQGKAFLGSNKTHDPKYAFMFRGRMDERYDMSRSIRDERFRYTRHFMPHRIFGQHLDYLWKAPATRSWENQFKLGKCNKAQSAFWQRKPAEELFDTKNDPHEINNLANDPKYTDTLKRMRHDLGQMLGDIYDTGFIPEPMMLDMIKEKNTTAYQLTRDPSTNIKAIIKSAQLASMATKADLPEIIKYAKDANPAIRYWAATAFLILGKTAEPAMPQIELMLKDNSSVIQLVAAEAIYKLNKSEQALKVITEKLQDENSFTALFAMNVMTEIKPEKLPIAQMKASQEKHAKNKYIARTVEYLLQ
ncbi:MAG: sulfatase-like hydrolase/transferase [Phycisphaerae bacterium]|nr:sulfatase-like hydrolase/transferase [Phycisphaerae bacterium]